MRYSDALPLFPRTRALLEERGCVFLLAGLADIPPEEAFAALHPEEQALCSDMALARRHEFAAGRMLARQALYAVRSTFSQHTADTIPCAEHKTNLGKVGGNAAQNSSRVCGKNHNSGVQGALSSSANEAKGSCRKKACETLPPLCRGPNGEPLWPEGIVGSITHTAGRAHALPPQAGGGAVALVCALRARRQNACSPGIDLEPFGRALSDAAWKHILSPSEEAFFSESTAQEIRILLFSAKESFFKALFPAVGRYIGFHEAGIVREDAAALQEQFTAFRGDSAVQLSGSFRLALQGDPGGAAPPAGMKAGEQFTCYWETDGGYVLTALGIE